jgi:RHS repeat-associated protein
MTGMTDESGSTVFSYDAFGRLSGKTQTTVAGNASSTLRVSYVYGTSGTDIGKLASMTYPSGNRVNYLYNDAGQLSALTLDPADAGAAVTNGGASVALLTGISYAPLGGVQSWYWGNSTADAVNGYARTFDLDGRITSYTLGNVQATGVLRHIAYDPAGRIIGYTHEGPSSSPEPVVLDQTFAYDDLDRLTGNESASMSLGFAYDANSNRTQATIGGVGYSNTVAATSNRLLSTTGPAPAKTNIYDAAGNLTLDGTASYTYSDRGRLAGALKAGLLTNYLYNGLGQRVSKAGAAVATGPNYFAYDEQGHLLGEYAANGSALQETVYLGDTPAVVLANGVSYVHADHLDTPRLITRAADNAIVWRWDQSDPFGVQPPLENPAGSGIFTYNLHFPGQVFDRETNNHYNYHRDYDPQTGRYIQSDPIGLGGGINTYGYVAANPVSLTDPTGEIVFVTPAYYVVAGLVAGTGAAFWWQQEHRVTAIPPWASAGGRIPPQTLPGGLILPPKQEPTQCHVQVPPLKPKMPPKNNCEDAMAQCRAVASTGAGMGSRAGGYLMCAVGYLTCKKMFGGDGH